MDTAGQFGNQLSIEEACEVEQYQLTVGQNIDRKIKYHQAEITRLEDSKKTLGPFLDMRIRDIREAML